MKKNSIFTIVALAFTAFGILSCSDEVSSVWPDNKVSPNVPLAEWGISMDDVAKRMEGYVTLSQTNNSLLYTDGNTSKQTYAFLFTNNQLSASSVVMPSKDLSVYTGAYNHIGLIGTKDVYTNTNLNTITTLYPAIDADNTLCAVGFLPIETDTYEELEIPVLTTNEPKIIDYSSVEVSGSATGLQADDSFGIIFGNESSLSDGVKLKSTEIGDCSFTLTQLEIGKTYYFCTYADAGDITYLGQILSFIIPSPNISVTTGASENITSNSVTINGSADISLDYESEYEYGFFLNTSGNPSKSNYVIDVKPDITQTKNFKANVSNLQDNTTYYYCAYVRCGEGYFYGSTKSFSTPKATKGILAGHEWVDLGLPSGLKWATCNVGATSPWRCGDYYAWGETYTKYSYSSDNYPYGNTNSHSYNIPYDISGTSYDVARTLWGSTWRMPTFSEIRELYYYCSFSWEYYNGIYGAWMTGQNGNSIFLPAGGGIGKGFTGSNGTSVSGQGTYGRYWSATMAYKQNWNEVKYLFFKQEGISLTSYVLGSYSDTNTNGFNGLLVRPVTK